MEIRDNSVDIAKGLGMFLVIWGHNMSYGDYAGLLIYSFHMPLFFLLSGIFHKQQTLFFQLIQSKSRSLLVPYIFFSLLVYLFYLVWALMFTGIDKFDFYSIYKLIPFEDAVSVPLWFFISLFEVIIIYFLLKRSIKNSWVLLLITLCVSVFSYSINRMHLSHFYNYFHIFSSFSMLFFYALGSELFRKFKDKVVPNSNVLRVLVLIVALSLFIYFNTFSKGIDVNGNSFNAPFMIYILAAIMGIYMLWIASVLTNKLNSISRFWIFIGKNSMGIFAIHMPMFELARPLVKLLILPGSDFSRFVAAIFTLIISIGVNEIFKIVFPFIYGLERRSVWNFKKKIIYINK